MEGRSSRRFALGFLAVIVGLAATLIVVAERSVRSRESWSIEAHAAPSGPTEWTLSIEPSHDVYVYAIAETADGRLELLLPSASDPASSDPTPAGRAYHRRVRTKPMATLLLLADPRPLWTLERARHEAARDAEGPVALDLEDLLAIRGLGRLADSPGEARARDLFPPLSDNREDVRGLWARRVS